MTSRERVLAACAFRPPDRIPRWDGFWEYADSWKARLGPREDLTDVAIWAGDETPFPSRARHLKEERGWIYEVDGWGRTIRRRRDAYFVETLEVALPEGRDPDSIVFEPPDLESRFLFGEPDRAGMLEKLRRDKLRHCVFAKTGGPFLRTTFLRGETQFLTDIASDPVLAKAIADKVGDHIAAVGVQELRRWSLHDTGIWIYDDMAYNDGPLFSPAAFERIFLPAYRRMIRNYREAGAKYVGLHSDGDIRPILDMLVDAGIAGLNPLERRAGMQVAQIRERYPRLILTGGVCNTDILVNGPIERINAHVREVIDLGRHGGVIIGTHSISPEVPLEHFVAYHETCRTYGVFTAG